MHIWIIFNIDLTYVDCSAKSLKVSQSWHPKLLQLLKVCVFEGRQVPGPWYSFFPVSYYEMKLIVYLLQYFQDVPRTI